MPTVPRFQPPAAGDDSPVMAEARKRIEQARREGSLALNLSGLKLTSLPEPLGQLSELQQLSLGDNRLTSVPEALWQLTNLRFLDLSGNRLKSVPEAVGQLTKLQVLDLAGNHLTRLPAEVGQLMSLRGLYLDENQLSGVPEALGQLSALQTISLSKNRLTSVPGVLGQLRVLRELFLDNNRMTSLPETVRQLTELRMLFLHGNPGLGLPAEALGPSWYEIGHKNAKPRTPAEILDVYFRLRAAVVKRPILEAKVILVGWGAVGKTSLRRRLVDGSFDAKEDKTHKIEITPWPVPVGSDLVKLHVWDFGGQEIMHATHQFFLTKRSLYVLVLAGREKVQGAQEAEYWLRLIASFGGDSPVLVVLNKQRGCPFDLNRTTLQEKYPFIRGFIQTDCQPELRLEELRKMILAEVDKLPDLRTPFDARWMAIKEAVTDLKLKGRKRMAVADYLKLCKRKDEKDEKWQRWLLGFLHDLGVVVCFHDDPQLANDGVLDPQWVVDGIYTVLNDPQLKGGDGQVTRAQVRTLLPAAEYGGDDLRVLLGMMQKFELCFPLAGSRSKLVVPELMTEQEADWKPMLPELEKCLRFELHYDFLPEGLLPRFIVATHDLSKAGERWRSGVILRQGRNLALVRGDAVDRKVTIAISGPGPTRRDVLAIVRRDFAKIHASISGLVVTEMVPVPGLEVEPIAYEDLLAAEEAGDKEWPVVADGVRYKISIATLLDGIEPKVRRKARANAGKVVIVELGGKHVEHEYMGDTYHTGDVTGSALGRGNRVANIDSFNAGVHGAELTKLFSTLTAQLSPLRDEMKGKDIKALDEHLEKFASEAQKPKEEVDGSALAVSGKGLIEAAQTVGEIASPVLTTVGLILKFFGVPLP